MTDLDIIYEEVFGEEEDMREFSMMMEKTKLMDKGKTVHYFKAHAAVPCTKMMIRAIKNLRKKGFESSKLDVYEKELTETLEVAKFLKKGRNVRRMDEKPVADKMKAVTKVLNKYISILKPICQKYGVRLFTFTTGNVGKSTIKNFNDFVILYTSNSASTMGINVGYASGFVNAKRLI